MIEFALLFCDQLQLLLVQLLLLALRLVEGLVLLQEYGVIALDDLLEAAGQIYLVALDLLVELLACLVQCGHVLCEHLVGLDVHESVLNLWREQAVDIAKASQVASQNAVGSQLGMHLLNLQFGLLCTWILQELHLLVVSLSMVDYFGPVLKTLVGAQRTC